MSEEVADCWRADGGGAIGERRFFVVRPSVPPCATRRRQLQRRGGWPEVSRAHAQAVAPAGLDMCMYVCVRESRYVRDLGFRRGKSVGGQVEFLGSKQGLGTSATLSSGHHYMQ